MTEFIESFYRASSDYCTLVENTKLFSLSDVYRKLREILPAIFYSIQKIEVDADTEDLFVQTFVSEEQWDFVFKDLKLKIGENDNYLEIAKPDMYNTDEVVQKSLAEDLADLYQTLKNFILNYDSGMEDVIVDAAKKCKFDFDDYWSETLLSALRNINLKRSIKTSDNDESGIDDNDDSNDSWFWSDNFNFLKPE